MPTTYAHWRFGDKCIKTLPEEIQDIIQNNRAIFDYGVHGPDIYFYYDCIKHNDVNQYGTDMHEIPFGETLKLIKPAYKSFDDKESAIAYLLGFCCHFTLDSYCHGYIDRKAEVSQETSVPTTHGIIESQYDKHLMIIDGYNPFKKKVTSTLKPNKYMAHVISSLFGTCDEEVTYKTLKDQKMYLNILKDNTDIKRKVLSKIMDVAKAPQFKDLLLQKKNFPEIEDSMMRLDKLFNKALSHYPRLAESLISYLQDDVPLDSYFKNHFCPKKDYKKIPILSVDAERNYEVEIQE